jgi:flagellar basal body P-ring formation protein FlgA
MMRTQTLLIWLSLSAMASGNGGPPARAAASPAPLRLTVRAESAAAREIISVGDVAEVTGARAESVRRLRAVSLGCAPGVGGTRLIPRSAIAAAIRAAGFSESEIAFGGAATARVRRDAQVVDLDVIRQSIERTMREKLDAGGDVSFEMPPLEDVPPIVAPPGEPDIRVAVHGAVGVSGTLPCVVEVRVAGRVVRRLTVQAKVNAYAKVFALSRAVAAGERIRESDGVFLRMRLTQPLARYVTPGRFPKAIFARRALAPREPVPRDALATQPVVKPGDAVRIIGRSEGVVVEVGGEARGTGRIGDRIQVRNKQSGVLLTALVEDEGVVSVKQ